MGGKSGGSQTTTTERGLPPWLEEAVGPLSVEGSNISRNALSNLERLLDTDNALVAPFDPAQETGQQQTLDLAQMMQSQPLVEAGQGALIDVAGGNVISENFPAVRDRLMGQGELPGQTVDTLTETARGDFLFGNSAFDEAVDASMRAAQPQIASTFAGQGGRGAIDSGLAQTAMQQVASDAFARQFGQERGRQQQAASTLGTLGLNQQQQNLQGPMALGGILEGERDRQLQAAGMAPQQALLGPELMQEIGARRQQQRERQMLEPIQQRQMLIEQAMGAANPFAFLGQEQSGQAEGDEASGALGGAATGASIGSNFGPWGTAIGAVGGGLLGGGAFE